MDERDLRICAEYFLEHQNQLFDEPVAENMEEACEFLDECMAQVFNDIHEVKDYFEDAGMDVDGMDDDEIRGQMEVFSLPVGRYLIVEG